MQRGRLSNTLGNSLEALFPFHNSGRIAAGTAASHRRAARGLSNSPTFCDIESMLGSGSDGSVPSKGCMPLRSPRASAAHSRRFQAVVEVHQRRALQEIRRTTPNLREVLHQALLDQRRQVPKPDLVAIGPHNRRLPRLPRYVPSSRTARRALGVASRADGHLR